MVRTDYTETVEARAFVRGATQFYTADEQAVIDALRAHALRQKARLGITIPGQRERWENELAAVDDAPPMDDPIVVAALAVMAGLALRRLSRDF